MALEKKQKIMIPLILAAFAFLGWEAYQMLGGDEYSASSTPAPRPHQSSKRQAVQPDHAVPPDQTTQSADQNVSPAMSAAVSKAADHSMSSNDTPRGNLSAAAPDLSTVTASVSPFTDLAPKPTVTAANTASTTTGATTMVNAQVNQNAANAANDTFMQAQQAREQQYIQMVNEYQLAAMQKKLADANADLAQAKLKEAQNIAKASQQNVALNQTALGNGAASPLQNYALLYVSYVNERWMAILRYQGRLQTVYIGSQFADGTSVRVIDRNGVVLAYQDQTRYLTIPVPLTTSSDNNGGAATGSTVERSSNTRGQTANTSAQTSQRAEDIYNTLNQIQQALPGN